MLKSLIYEAPRSKLRGIKKETCHINRSKLWGIKPASLDRWSVIFGSAENDPKNKGFCWLACLALAAMLFLGACTEEDNPIEQRAGRAEKSTGDIIIGAASPWGAKRNLLWQGIEMAVSEINNSGGVLNRKIRIIKQDDRSSAAEGMEAAYRFAENMDMVAVIGHSNSYISIPASIIYEYYGLVMISPLSTNRKLTRQGFSRIFRNIPDDHIFGKELAKFCHKQGYRRVMIYHSQNDYGRGLANAFERKCEERGIETPDRISYDSFGNYETFKQDLEFWRDIYTFDAIFLAGLIPQAAEFTRAARQLGIEVPIIGGDGLDHPKYLEIAGKDAEGTFAGSVFNPNDPHQAMKSFSAVFADKYGRQPDIAATQGYEAVKILAGAIKKAGSTVPDKIARALREEKTWPGLTGDFSFDQRGDVVGKPVFIKIVRDDKYEFYEY